MLDSRVYRKWIPREWKVWHPSSRRSQRQKKRNSLLDSKIIIWWEDRTNLCTTTITFLILFLAKLILLKLCTLAHYKIVSSKGKFFTFFHSYDIVVDTWSLQWIPIPAAGNDRLEFTWPTSFKFGFSSLFVNLFVSAWHWPCQMSFLHSPTSRE